MTPAILIVAVLIWGGLAWAGRRDLSHPAVAFGLVWFAWVAISQIRLTNVEGPWSRGFAALVFGGALALIGAAVVAGGTVAVRGTIRPRERNLRVLLVAAAILGVIGLAGLVWEAHILGGIPLFSGEIDVLRARAYTVGHHVPSFAGYMINGLHLACWLLLAALFIAGRRWSRRLRLAIGVLAIGAFVGAAAGGSRNALLFTVLVPVIAAYVLRGQPFSSRQRLGIVASALLAVAVLGAFSVYRTNQQSSGLHNYVVRSIPHASAAHRALFLLYIGGAFGFESERRLVANVPRWFAYDSGLSSFDVLPNRFFPNGKPPFSSVVAAGIRNKEPDVDWTVATYQARPFYDFGSAGVLVASLVTGLVLGAAYRLARARTWLLAAVVAAIAAYYAAFMFYVNQLSLDRTWAYDIVVLAIVEYLALRSAQRPGRATA